jgi:hypothetical protein
MMRAGPLRQGVAVLGLLALTPTLLFVALGSLSPGEGAVRALVTFGVTLLVGWTLSTSLRFYVRMADRAHRHANGRRTGDHVA